jgi:5-formyltetrahydrofolate cyclo-ligase
MLRRQMRSVRSALSSEEMRQISLAVCIAAFELPEIQVAKTVHVYDAIVSRHETDTGLLISLLQSAGKRIVMPVVRDFNSAKNGMTHHEFRDERELTLNRWGVREPVGGAVVPSEEIDAVIVPALAVDKLGHRLGYGMGYYDAFLPQTSATTIALCPAACLIDKLPTEPHDVGVDIVITESSIIRLAFT